MTDVEGVKRHYESHTLTERLRAALTAAGLDDRRLAPQDLAPLDQFHSRGLAATVELAGLLEIEPTTAVLDVGSGLGGPSRYLAATYGCHVTGIDLSQSFVEAAEFLAERAGLADRVSYKCVNALAMTFADASFDLAWTQHVAMNIADRSGLYAEIHRVLRPGGRLAIFDVVAGDVAPLHFPVPWSRSPDTSFLVTPDAMRAALEQQGFRTTSWIDGTEAGVAWFAAMQNAQTGGPPPALGLHLAVGPDFKTMAANLGRNLEEGRARLVQTIAVRS